MSALPEAVRVIVEDIYAQGIAHSFLIAVPIAVISLIAIIFLPNKPLTRMTTSERIAAGEADLATVSTAEGMAALDATGTVPHDDGCGSPRVRRTSHGPHADAASVDRDVRAETREARTEAVRALEAEFGELISRMRRMLADNAQRVSPGMLPGAYKVFTTIVRRESVTLSALAESLMADKGQISRTVRELEGLGLIARTPDPADGRSSLLSPTPEGLERLAAARAPQESVLLDTLDAWSVDEIRNLTRLLHALTAGERPDRSAPRSTSAGLSRPVAPA